MAERTCTVDGCGKKHQARGLCSTHYNRNRYTPEQRHAKTTVSCDWCGKPTRKELGRAKRYGGLFCSLSCRDLWRKATDTHPEPTPEARAKARAVLDSRPARARRALARAARGSRGTHWVGGECARCEAPFISSLGSKLGQYCSDSCKRRTKSSRRRARDKGAHHEPYSRIGIFERDGWRCHICLLTVHRHEVVPHAMAPTIDHLIPLARGGDDTAANVATAHFLCNSTKGERGGGEQLALFG